MEQFKNPVVDVDLSELPLGKNVTVYISERFAYRPNFPLYPIDGYGPKFQLHDGTIVALHKDDGHDGFMNIHSGEKSEQYVLEIKISESDKSYWVAS